MTDQDPVTGKFVKGNKANPGGRKRSDLSISALIDKCVTEADWIFIIEAQVKRARRGDQKSIEWLTDRRFGKAIQTNKLANEEGDTFRLEIVQRAEKAN